MKIVTVVIAAALSIPAGFAAAQSSGAAEQPPRELRLRYSYDGYLGENHGEVGNCKGARRNGSIKVSADLRHNGGMPPNNVEYAGRGQVSFDIDECSLKPVNGENDYCTMTIVANYEADVVFEIDGVIEGEPREAWLRWKPAGNVTSGVDGGDCTAADAAQVRREIVAGIHFNAQHISPIFGDVLNAMARGGIPRTGTYKDPSEEPSDVGRWTMELNEEEDCETESIALANARDQVASQARDVQTTFNEMRSLANSLAGTASIAPVASFLESQQGSMTSAFAARGAAPAGSSRDAADAAYGRAVANVTAQQSANTGRVAAAQVPAAPGGAVDPRVLQLSSEMTKFSAQAQTLATLLSEEAKAAKRYEECLKSH